MSVKDTTILNRSDLKYLLIDSLKLYSDNVIFIDGRNPYRFSVNKKNFFALIKNVHESGDGRGNQDECRIQISRTRNFDPALSTMNYVIVLGYFADENVFTAWNPFVLMNRFNQRQTISVYSRFSIQREAHLHKIASYIDSNGNSIISFRPEYLGLYLENLNRIHQLSPEELKNLANASDNIDIGDTEESISVPEKDFTVTIKHTRYRRDPEFRDLVTNAYNHRCAMCGLQLELVEAAHIIPHSHELGTDEVNNGIALCSLHHKAYDRSLIYFNEDFEIKINLEKIQYLEKIGKDSGFRKFESLNFDRISLPSNYTLRPSAGNIKLANTIRGIEYSSSTGKSGIPNSEKEP